MLNYTQYSDAAISCETVPGLKLCHFYKSSTLRKMVHLFLPTFCKPNKLTIKCHLPQRQKLQVISFLYFCDLLLIGNRSFLGEKNNKWLSIVACQLEVVILFNSWSLVWGFPHVSIYPPLNSFIYPTVLMSDKLLSSCLMPGNLMGTKTRSTRLTAHSFAGPLPRYTASRTYNVLKIFTDLHIIKTLPTYSDFICLWAFWSSFIFTPG